MDPQAVEQKLESPKSTTKTVDDSLKGKTFTHQSPSRVALEAFVANYGSKRVVSYEEMQGNPDVGTIELLKQVHNVDGLPLGSLHTTGEYQAELLRILLKERPVHIFSESASEDSETAEPSILHDSPVGDATQEVISNGKLPEELDDTLLRALSQRGAAWFYNQIEDSAVLHHVSSAREHADYKAQLARIPDPLDALDIHDARDAFDARDAIIMDHREGLAMAHVMNFLDKHPGERVYMIFGAAHQWGQEDFAEEHRSEEKRPQINARVIPGLVAKDSIPESIATDLAQFPELEKKVISASRHVSPFLLPVIGDMDNFKLALSKSDLDTTAEFPETLLLASLVDQPERQALLLDKLLSVSPYAVTKLANAQLQVYALDTANIRGDESDYFLAATIISEPGIELRLLGFAERLDAKTEAFVDSDEARQIVQIKSSSLADTREVIGAVRFDHDWLQGAIDRATSLSPAVLRALPTAEFQEQALPKIAYQRGKERELYNEEFIKEHARLIV